MEALSSVREVRELLYVIRKKWYDIGIELDVTLEDLDKIKYKNEDDPHACLTDLLALRLRAIDPCPLTWKNIAEALRARAVAKPDLANEGTYHLHD